MSDINQKSNIFKIIIGILCVVMIIFLVKRGINLLQNISKICVVENGSLKFEERAEGYILRNENVLQGENYKNGMVQIISEGQKVAKNKPVFRYYSNGEEDLLSQIDMLDNEINAEMESSGLTIFSTDITNLETQIEKIADSMYRMNDLEEIQDKISELNSYISKKTKIAGALSPADSYVKTLIEQRNQLESNLTNGSEIIIAPVSGVVSYRIDGLEEILSVTDFGYLSTEFLEKLDTKSGAIIAPNTEKGKVVNNFSCFIACPMNTEKASVANIGDEVILRLPSGDEVNASIEYIVQEKDDKRVLVFKIKDAIEGLIEYRQVPVDIIWWSYNGLKISNSAILEENDMNYVERTKAGYKEKIYIKISRQNDTYSIVKNYTDEELQAVGFDSEYIKNRTELNLYDEILLH